MLTLAAAIPCVVTVARDVTGPRLHVEAADTAAAVATAIGADTLVVGGDTPGIRINRGRAADDLTVAKVEAMTTADGIDRDLLPSVQACVRADGTE